jgi:hypothetical protein
MMADRLQGSADQTPSNYPFYGVSRPRLTKEQYEILEAQFQVHPKPNGEVKRQLTIQTNLSFPRVANWFQNRRAKAKQQKRQDEFHRIQASGKAANAVKKDNDGSNPANPQLGRVVQGELSTALKKDLMFRSKL